MGADKTADGFDSTDQSTVTVVEKEKQELIAQMEKRKVAVRYAMACESQLYSDPEWPKWTPVVSLL